MSLYGTGSLSTYCILSYSGKDLCRLDICITPECIGWNLISSGMVLGLVPLEETRLGKGRGVQINEVLGEGPT